MPEPGRVSIVRSLLSRLGHWLTRQHASPNWLSHGWGSPLWFQHGLPGPTPSQPALAFPAVYTSIDTISSDIARLPFRHFRIENGIRTEVERSAALRALDQPNGYQSGFDLMKQFIAAQLYRGNSYLFARRNRRNEIDELHVLFPDLVWPYRSGSEVFYEVSPTPLAAIDIQRMLTTRECLHHRMLTLSDPLFGITPLYAAALSSSAGLAILKQSEQFFRNMGRPSGVLSTPGKLDKERAEDIKARWKAVYGGAAENAGDIAVLEQGLQWTALTLTATDAQLIEQLRYTVEDVARVYRLPLFMLGDLTKVNYNSSEQLIRIYYAGCLASHLDAIEERLSHWFDMDFRHEWLEFDLDELFRTEMVARINSLTRAIQGGLRTPNEARAVEGLNPLAGGDQIYMQQQMVPVETLAVRPQIGAPPPPAPTPAQPAPPRIAPPPPGPSQDEIEANITALRDRLMDAVYGDAPRLRLVSSRPPQRMLIDGRTNRGAA